MDTNVLGKRIKKLREKKKLNQIEFSKILNISNTTLSQYEAGNRTPSDQIKEKVADYFDVSIDYLLGRTDIYNSQNAKSEIDTLHNLDVSNLPEDDIRKVKEYVEMLKQKYNSDGSLKNK